jgi:hypothetical protein
MFAENRRAERREDILDLLEDKGFVINNIVDYTSAEEDGFLGKRKFALRPNQFKAYCALHREQTKNYLLNSVKILIMHPLFFEAFQTVDSERKLIYHTNVMMCLGETFAVICSDCIDDKKERKMVLDNLKENGKEVILITESQMNNFAGNMLELRGTNAIWL